MTLIQRVQRYRVPRLLVANNNDSIRRCRTTAARPASIAAMCSVALIPGLGAVQALTNRHRRCLSPLRPSNPFPLSPIARRPLTPGGALEPSPLAGASAVHVRPPGCLCRVILLIVRLLRFPVPMALYLHQQNSSQKNSSSMMNNSSIIAGSRRPPFRDHSRTQQHSSSSSSRMNPRQPPRQQNNNSSSRRRVLVVLGLPVHLHISNSSRRAIRQPVRLSMLMARVNSSSNSSRQNNHVLRFADS